MTQKSIYHYLNFAFKLPTNKKRLEIKKGEFLAGSILFTGRGRDKKSGLAVPEMGVGKAAPNLWRHPTSRI